jgi:cation transport regulator ChaB
MPYNRLPARLRQMIPAEHGQQLFANIFNSQMKSGKPESVAFASAWAGLQDAGYKKVNGQWVRKEVEKAKDHSYILGLKVKAKDHNEKSKYKVTFAQLKEIHSRGLASNPGGNASDFGSAMGRVNSFLEYVSSGKKPKFDQDIYGDVRKSSPTPYSVHVPSTEWEKADTYKAPAAARAAASKAIRWKEEYGDKVRGGTQVGWTRAGQLARNENLSRETVARMASFFARHKGNEAVDPKYKDEPWRDAGYTSFLIWGGPAGREWSQGVMNRINKRQIDDDSFTMPDEARSRSMELGLGGAIHVSSEDAQQAVYMPGETHEDYIDALNRIAGIETESDDDEEPVKEGLIERAISAIIGAVMQHTDVNKSFEETKILKVDDEQRIVYGWASVVTEDGEPVVDSQGDVIEPKEMVKMANDFMLAVRTAKAMHKGEKIGEVIHSMPLTAELSKALGLHTDMEGWIVGVKVYSDEVWKSVKSGEFAGFSIGGKASSREKMA